MRQEDVHVDFQFRVWLWLLMMVGDTDDNDNFENKWWKRRCLSKNNLS